MLLFKYFCSHVGAHRPGPGPKMAAGPGPRPRAATIFGPLSPEILTRVFVFSFTTTSLTRSAMGETPYTGGPCVYPHTWQYGRSTPRATQLSSETSIAKQGWSISPNPRQLSSGASIAKGAPARPGAPGSPWGGGGQNLNKNKYNNNIIIDFNF